MNSTLTSLLDYWKQRNSRERAILAVGATVLLLALLYTLLIEPVARERARLEKSLPTLRADVARFGRDLALASGKGSVSSKPDLIALAVAAGLPAGAAQMNAGKQGSLHVQAATWPMVSRLLADAQAQGWALTKLQVRSPDGGTNVDADAEWQR